MTIVSSRLRAISAAKEPSGAFATDIALGASYLAVPAQYDSMKLTTDRPLRSPKVLKQYKHSKGLKVHGPRAATVAMRIPFGLTGTLADTATASLGEDASALYRLLSLVMGGIRSGNMGSTVLGVPGDAFTIPVQAGHGARFTAGGAIGWTNADGVIEMREIAGVTVDTLTLKVALSATPANTNPIYNATTFFLDDGDRSLQFITEGLEPDDFWRVAGAQLQSMELTFPFGDLPMLGLNMQAAEWEFLAGGAAVTGKTYGSYAPIAHNKGELIVQVEGVRTRNLVQCSEYNAKPSLAYIPVPGVEGVNTVVKYLQQHGDDEAPVSVATFGTYYEDQTWYAAWLARTLYHVAYTFGQSSSGAWLITHNAAQIGPAAAPADAANGILGSMITAEPSIDNDATSQATAIRRSPMRLHCVG